MTRLSPLTVRFLDFELDSAAYELRRHGRRIRLARQPMELLVLLLERPGELVSRQDIAERVWAQGVFVDLEAGIHTAILKIRRALGDSPASPTFIETVSGKGYRFIAPVRVVTPPTKISLTGAPAGSHVRPGAPRHNLPADLTNFVGRRHELTELRRLLASARLVSLTGTGGVGKTRLALKLAADQADEFPDGAWLADLAPLTSPDLMAQTIAHALGVREGGQRPLREVLLEHLRGRALLLVLDNCEHLIQACAELVESLLRGAPTLRIVTTSREALGVAGESVYRVPSLSVPERGPALSVEALSDYEATQLFLERARPVDSEFASQPESAEVIARICRRLDGIPLAIELAAARIVMLSPAQIEARLDDRFRLLTGGLRTVLPRQRTLEATVEWSYQLLTDDERRLLSRLSVFPGSWTLESAEHVAADEGTEASGTLELLSRLVAKSLVAIDSAPGAERRYHLLETIRQYGVERLVEAGAAERLRQRHFEFFFAEFGPGETTLRSHGQVALIRRLLVEQENIRAALAWAFTSPEYSRTGAELATALFWFWTKRGQFEEGRRWLERARAAAGEGTTVRARILIGLAHMYYFQGDYLAAGDSVAEALAIGRETGDAWIVAFALFLQGLAAFEQRDLDQAEARSLASRAAATTSGDPWQHGGPLLVLASVAVARGKFAQARQLFDESIDVHRQVGDTWGLGVLLSAGAGLRVVLGDSAAARVQAAEALAIAEELDDRRGAAWTLEVFAALAASAGQAEDAVRLWGASDGLLERLGSSLAPTIRWVRDRYFEAARASLGHQQFVHSHKEGRALQAMEAIALAKNQR
jgi:non-specific serine/threonine protein kinase